MIDWQQVRDRLRQSEEALARSANSDDARRDAVFRQRAWQLAGRGKIGKSKASTTPLLVFSLAGEKYALEMALIVQVFPFARCTPVPGAPPELVGVANLRGEIRSVLDLRRILALPPVEEGQRGFLIQMKHGSGEVGFRVDQLDRVEEIPLAELRKPSEAAALTAQYVRGLSESGVIVLNVPAIWQHPVFAQDEIPV